MKNAVMMLNEMFPPPGAPQYKVVSMSGTPNNPTFEMAVTIMEQSFNGSGRSKKEAKLAASQLALEKLFGKEFTKGEGDLADSEIRGQHFNITKSPPEIEAWMALEGKNPVSILNELYPGAIFSLVSAEGPSHAPEFCVTASLASLTLEGRGNSKREAKLHASKALLAHIHQVGFDPMTGGLRANNNDSDVKDQSSTSHNWADKIGSLVRNEYNKLFEGTTYHRRKVLAGIVVDRSGTSSVICLSTGTKCINGELLSLDGLSLNDCHAEVIVRRCLMFWLYDQLEETFRGQDTVLEKDQERVGGYKVKSGVSFHLFISTAPCGDARIFSLHEQQPEDSNLLSGYAGRLGEGNRGKLRSKIESGMGTVPLPDTEDRLQTWDGVLSGERLLTMACSDKILSWNVIGLQGSLLSHWLRPVYLSSITIGSKFHPDHVTRALYGRLAGSELLLTGPGYRLNQPPLLATTSPEARQPSKAADHSVNWIRGHSPEVVICSSGKTNQGEPSRLCKRSLADIFRKLCSYESSHGALKTSFSSGFLKHVTYEGVKAGARQHQQAKLSLVRALLTNGCGRWVKKPVEQNQFPMNRAILSRSKFQSNPPR